MSPPVEIDGIALKVKSSNLDPQEVRFSLLFWDKLGWPSSRALHFRSGPNEEFLEQAGVLRRPDYTVPGDVASGIAMAQIQAFVDLDEREPGVWSIAQGETSLLLKGQIVREGNGAFVELHRAIPVPDKDVPLNDILEFRAKRHDELQLLRSEIDDFVALANASNDEDAEKSKLARLTALVR